MKTHYICSSCKIKKLATDKNFFPSYLKKAQCNPNVLSIGQCKICANEYSEKWRANLKDKKLVRSQRTTIEHAKAVNGTVYVFGSDIPGTPYKIGITSGTDTRKRLSSVQTGNWVKIKEIWKSDYIPRVDKIEEKLHNHFDKLRISGEWFSITKQDIENIKDLIETFSTEIK
jgi:hypothetical protein